MDVRHAQTGSGVAGAKVQGIATYNNSVFRGKYCQLIEASNEVPTRGDVASDEDAEGHGREGVHRALLLLVGHAAGQGAKGRCDLSPRTQGGMPERWSAVRASRRRRRLAGISSAVATDVSGGWTSPAEARAASWIIC